MSIQDLDKLLLEIRACTVCKEHLPLGPKPVLRANSKARIAIIGQAPGTKVHATGIPWDDQSGKELRRWLNVSDEQFYNEEIFAIIPMGFCYPGKGRSGDLPPRPECAPLWHRKLFESLPNVELILLIGKYAQHAYLLRNEHRNLTETVKHYNEFLPKYFPLVHPSPRNKIWQKKNPWFEKELLPVLQLKVSELLA